MATCKIKVGMVGFTQQDKNSFLVRITFCYHIYIYECFNFNLLVMKSMKLSRYPKIYSKGISINCLCVICEQAYTECMTLQSQQKAQPQIPFSCQIVK